MNEPNRTVDFDRISLGVADDARVRCVTLTRHVGLLRGPGIRLHRADSPAFRAASPTTANDVDGDAGALDWGSGTDARVHLAPSERCTFVKAIMRRRAGAPLPRLGLTVYGLFSATTNARAMWCSLATASLWPGEVATASLVPLGAHPVALAFVPWVPEKVQISSSTIEILVGAVLS